MGSQFVPAQDGDAYYRIDVDPSCDGLALSTRFELSTQGQAGRVCPQDSQVVTNRGGCQVSSVKRIDSRHHARYLRGRR
ncbi:MAG: hypothetical protein M3Q40_09645 [Pseudomonadota bacterium]|nr:hypothetical protein [Pseudomonadota bacterium]